MTLIYKEASSEAYWIQSIPMLKDSYRPMLMAIREELDIFRESLNEAKISYEYSYVSDEILNFCNEQNLHSEL